MESQGSDTDLAILTKHLFDGEYSCVSIKHHKWYKFRNHRWLENDCGTGLRSELSKKINKLYVDKTRSEKDMAANPDIGSAEREKHIEKFIKLKEFQTRLLDNSHKLIDICSLSENELIENDIENIITELELIKCDDNSLKTNYNITFNN